MDATAVFLTLKLALVTTVILAVIGIPLAYWLATSTAKWRPIVDALVALPLLLPPTVLGFYLLMGMGPSTPLGRAYAAVAGSTQGARRPETGQRTGIGPKQRARHFVVGHPFARREGERRPTYGAKKDGAGGGFGPSV